MELIGRLREQEIISDCIQDTKSHFIAIYGRRRVGKTYLVRKYFNNDFDFYVTGLAKGNKSAQLTNFCLAIQQIDPDVLIDEINDWMAAFRLLISVLEKSSSKKKIIFMDELPWMDTPRANFITALEYFWNSWASARNDIVLIACGSAASWMLNNLINNKAGLFNRVTKRIKLSPFDLAEVEAFLKAKSYHINRYQILQLYMAVGGIPFYLDLINKEYSVAQNIQKMFFERNAMLQNEYEILFKSLFEKSETHNILVKALTKKKTGLTRKELLKITKLKDGGSITRVLNELIASDFIRNYRKFGNKNNNVVYQLTDPFTLFHYRFVEDFEEESNFWINQLNTPSMYSWQGNAFELICLLHVEKIKDALGISGVQTSISTWWSEGAQIDLVIDRKDQLINLVEIKFALDEYEINKSYDEKLRKKLNEFQKATKTKKSLWTTMLTTYGIKQNKYSGNVQKSIVMDELF